MQLTFLPLFAQSILIGISIAAPVGPIGLLTIQRTLREGAGAGLATGLGAAVADAIYSALGAYGVDAVIRVLAAARVPVAILGALILLWLARATWRAPIASRAAQPRLSRRGAWGYFTGTVLLTLSNPMTIFSFVAVFGALAARSREMVAPGLVVMGTFVGSALWWLLLSVAVGRLRERFDARWQRDVQRASAVLLLVFALWQLWGLGRVGDPSARAHLGVMQIATAGSCGAI